MNIKQLKLLNKVINNTLGFDIQSANNYINRHADFKHKSFSFIKRNIKFKEFNENCFLNQNSNLKVIKDILSIFEGKRSLIPIIQGSYADGTAHEGWSDLDMAIIVKEEMSIGDIEELYKIVRSVKKIIFDQIQPLQHHGIFIVDRDTLNCYPESFMPTAAFKDAASLKSGELTINECLQKEYFLETLKSRFVYIENAISTRYYSHHKYKGMPLDLDNPRKSLYQVYAYINYLFLVPCIAYSALGKSTYKGKVLTQSRHWNLSEKSINCFKKINYFRDEWIAKRFIPISPDENLPDFLLKYMYDDFWESCKSYEGEFIRIAKTGA